MGWFPGGGGDLTSLTHCLGAQGLQPNSSGKRVCDIAGDERVKASPSPSSFSPLGFRAPNMLPWVQKPPKVGYKMPEHWWVVSRGGNRLSSETTAPGPQARDGTSTSNSQDRKQVAGDWGPQRGAWLPGTIPLGSLRGALPRSPSLPGVSCGHRWPWPPRSWALQVT